MPEAADRELTRQIHGLRSRRERERAGVFYVEGVRFVAEALAAGATVELIVFSPKLLAPSGRRALERGRAARIPTREVAVGTFLDLTLSPEPQGLGAIVRQRWTRLRQVHPGKGDCWLAHESIQSPGNLGTILRTSDAAGARGVILLGGQVDPYDPAAVRATMGSIFHQRIVRSGPAELREWKTRHGARLVGASPRGELDYRQTSWRGPVVLMMGSERKGLSPVQEALCDEMVRIPMSGRADSLNLGVAAGLLLYEFARQHGSPPGTPTTHQADTHV